MKEKWLDLTRPQQILIIIQGFLILLFWILFLSIGQQQAIEYRGEHLRLDTDGSTVTYSGKIERQKAVFTVTGNTLKYQLGDTLYGPYTVVEDPSAALTEENKPIYVTSRSTLTGVELWDGSELLFRGFYLKNPFLLYDEHGEIVHSFSIFSSQPVPAESATGITVTYIKEPSPTVSEILQIVLVPDISQRGYFGGFALGTLLCIACAISILYADKLFRWNLRFQIRNAEHAEPSDWELFSRWIGWIVFTICALALFILSLSYTH